MAKRKLRGGTVTVHYRCVGCRRWFTREEPATLRKVAASPPPEAICPKCITKRAYKGGLFAGQSQPPEEGVRRGRY